ncbi:Hypothetical protein, putative [Bodo saltans]|uniref:Uncharacterized protein n=1 Tax=Bodo saltans TaxID=75058 RepID=A0A0S4IVF5_BODSA|nr:Hypothetical protein, putative [Bodo saltans]|eukprot:CUG18428.1 Hypothetical protein, putative [Bodo saltans]
MDALIDHVPALLSVGPCSLPPGWLDAVDERPSLLDALLCLVGCPLPVNRGDLINYHADLNERALRDWYQHAADTVTRAFPQFPVDSKKWQDACVIMLYTCQSPICYMINGMLTQRGRVANQLSASLTRSAALVLLTQGRHSESCTPTIQFCRNRTTPQGSFRH